MEWTQTSQIMPNLFTFPVSCQFSFHIFISLHWNSRKNLGLGRFVWWPRLLDPSPWHVCVNGPSALSVTPKAPVQPGSPAYPGQNLPIYGIRDTGHCVHPPQNHFIVEFYCSTYNAVEQVVKKVFWFIHTCKILAVSCSCEKNSRKCEYPTSEGICFVFADSGMGCKNRSHMKLSPLLAGGFVILQ